MRRNEDLTQAGRPDESGRDACFTEEPMMPCPKRFAAFLFVFGALVLAIPTLAAAQP